MPKTLEKLCTFIPVFQIGCILFFIFQIIFLQKKIAVFYLFATIYLFPVIGWRLFHFIYPLKEGLQFIGKRESKGSPWIAAYYFQFLLNTFPVFEKILICVPELYSLWLRCWGSHVGIGVVWTPSIQVVDRTHLNIADYAFIGSLVFISTHTIRRKKGRLLLFFKKVQIGSKAIIGYGAIVGPGAVVPDLLEVRAMSYCFQNKIQEGPEWKL